MNMIEVAISTIAPHRCIVCARKGYLVCEPCEFTTLLPIPPRCYVCYAVTKQSQVCLVCRKRSQLDHVWVAATYEGAAKDLLEQMKFHRASAASKDIARVLVRSLPLLPTDTVVCHVPTAHNRIRRRGFDQSQLIARQLAASKGLRYVPVFRRVSSSRQVGASREMRIKQAAEAFALRSAGLQEARVLIVDDVTTSGATIETLAKLCRQAGAQSVDACVFAQAID